MRRYTSKVLKLSYIVIVMLVCLVLLIGAAFAGFQKRLESIVCLTAEQQISDVIYCELYSYLKDKGELSDFIRVSYDNDNNITGITIDSARINSVNNELGIRLSEAVDKLCDSKATFPAGTVSGIDILSGRGFDISVRYHSISNVNTDIVSEFEECGINQTKHTLKLVITTDINAVMPGKDMDITTNQEFILSETVIVGKIPEVYLNKK